MIAKIYGVKDELNEKFMEPTFIGDSENVEQIAIRTFEYQINNIAIWRSNPSDFSLFYLGDFDTETGKITTQVKKIVGGRSVVRKERDEETENL